MNAHQDHASRTEIRATEAEQRLEAAVRQIAELEARLVSSEDEADRERVRADDLKSRSTELIEKTQAMLNEASARLHEAEWRAEQADESFATLREALETRFGAGRALKPIALREGLSAAAQPTPEDFAALAASGFTTVINNRPDDEEPGQLSAADGARLAHEHGMTYHHLPVTGATLSRDAVERFGALVAGADGSVLAHCRSGTRSTLLYVIGEVLAGRMRANEILPFGEARGLDLRAALDWLGREQP